jgi:hypothetical protein
VETGRRLTAPRRLLTVVLATALIVSVSGCPGDDDDDDDTDTTTTETPGDTGGTTTTADTAGDPGGTGTTTTVTLNATLADVLAEYQEQLASTPDAIAKAMQLLGLTEVTPEQVSGLALDLCKSAFNPAVVTMWLQAQATTTSIFMMQPANRLLRYSGTVVCARPPTPAERANYGAALVDFLLPEPQASAPAASPAVPTELPQAPRQVATAVCDVLGSSAGGEAAETGLEALANGVSGGRFDSGLFVSAAVWIAGASCKDYLPEAAEAVHRFFTRGATDER